MVLQFDLIHQILPWVALLGLTAASFAVYSRAITHTSLPWPPKIFQPVKRERQRCLVPVLVWSVSCQADGFPQLDAARAALPVCLLPTVIAWSSPSPGGHFGHQFDREKAFLKTWYISLLEWLLPWCALAVLVRRFLRSSLVRRDFTKMFVSLLPSGAQDSRQEMDVTWLLTCSGEAGLLWWEMKSDLNVKIA